MILRQTNRHNLAVLLTAELELADAVCMHVPVADDDGVSGTRQRVCDLQSNDDGCFRGILFGVDFDFIDTLDLLVRREPTDCR